MEGDDARVGVGARCRREAVRPEACAEDGVAGARLAALVFELETGAAGRDAAHGAMSGNQAPALVHLLGERPRHRREVDDAGGRGVQAGHSARVGLELLYPVAVEPPQAGDPVRMPTALELVEPRQLVVARGDDDLAAALGRDAALVAVLVQQPRALDAQPRLERAGRVVDAGVDHAAVAPRLVHPDLAFLLENADAEPRAADQQLACHGQPDDPGTDDGEVALAGGINGRSHGRGA